MASRSIGRLLNFGLRMLNERSGSWTTVDDRRGSIREIATVFGLAVGGWLVLWALKGGVVSFEFGQARLHRTWAPEVVYVIVLWPWLASREQARRE